VITRGLVATLVTLTAVARAETPNLRLVREPTPRHLRMRPRAAAVGTPASAAEGPAVPPSAPPTAAAPAAAVDATDDGVGLVRDLRRPVSVRFNMGYVVDGTAPTGRATHNGTFQQDGYDYRRLRAYALGEGYVSSRGVLLPSLSTYFAGAFQIAQPQTHVYPDGEHPIAPPVATWFQRSGFLGRSAWLEVKDFLDDKRFAPLRVRAGQQYVYGPWMLHMYGALAAWEGKLTKLSVYGGSRVPDYTLVEVTDKDRSGIFGASARVDLRALKQKIPFALGLEVLRFTARGGPTETPSQHGLVQLDWRPREDVALIGRARLLDREMANQQVQLRTRYKQVTNLVFDLTYRHETDWRWDPAVTNPDPLLPRRYLDLGPVVPQMIFSGRAGTLIKENVDVLVRGAIADDRVSTLEERSTFAASYAELGGGFEVRLRRTIGLGVTGLTRQTKRYALLATQIIDVPGSEQPLPRMYSPEVGERGFVELGSSLRMSLGARRFSAIVEGYGRRTRYALTYCASALDADGEPIDCRSSDDDGTGILTRDYRFGGRITIDAWIGQQLRMFASYELSSRIDLAPEISGYKSLRLMMEGVY
jgi:hypothetical protein